MTRRGCTVPGCDQVHEALGLCPFHYQRQVNGVALDQIRREDIEPSERFWSKVNKHGGFPDFTDPLVRVTEADGECWLWTAGTGSGNYGAFWMWGRTYSAHRARLLLDGVVIPEGCAPDHLCRVKKCVRHLEVVTDAENVIRSDGPAARNARKTHCKHGHEFTPENTKPVKGGRACRECSRIMCREYQRARRQRLRAGRGLRSWS